jgi:hypothetical protein
MKPWRCGVVKLWHGRGILDPWLWQVTFPGGTGKGVTDVSAAPRNFAPRRSLTLDQRRIRSRFIFYVQSNRAYALAFILVALARPCLSQCTCLVPFPCESCVQSIRDNNSPMSCRLHRVPRVPRIAITLTRYPGDPVYWSRESFPIPYSLPLKPRSPLRSPSTPQGPSFGYASLLRPLFSRFIVGV